MLALVLILLTAAAEAAAPAPRVKLAEGTLVRLKFAEDVSSKTATEEDPVNFELDEDLVVDGVVVARAGAMAVGYVTSAKRAGFLGQGAQLSVRVEYLKVGSVRVRLRGRKAKTGEDKTGATVVLTALFGPLGLIKKGKDISVPKGAPLEAYVDQDVELAPAAAPSGRLGL